MPAVPPCRLCFQGEGQLSCPFSEDRKQTALPKRPNFSRIALCTLPVARKKKKKRVESLLAFLVWFLLMYLHVWVSVSTLLSYYEESEVSTLTLIWTEGSMKRVQTLQNPADLPWHKTSLREGAVQLFVFTSPNEWDTSHFKYFRSNLLPVLNCSVISD